MASRERSFTVSNGKVTYGADRSSYQYQYDACNNLTRLVTSVGTNKWNTTYTYDADNRAQKTTLSTGKVITNTYDTVNRLTKRTIGLSSTYTTTLEYYENTATLSKYKNGTDLAYVYLYDDNGNITQIKQNGVEVIGYTYDSANRLIRENNTFNNKTLVYTYDTWGNMTSKKAYAYTTGTPSTLTGAISYTYGNSAWCDQLTKLNGVTIPYDGNGNPLTYREWTFQWRGKQLISATKDSNTLTFAYDENGLRHKKVYNGVTTNYYYNGSLLIGMERAGTKYLFSYDSSGNVVSVKYNGAEYYYLRNGQGDIVKLIDASGATVVQYIYDTWGKKISTTGSMASTLGLIQPFRYRGYVYDFEWGYYYLESRYYDTYTGRFISSDVLLSTGQGVIGHNSYAYCLDNPVMMQDDSGSIPSYRVNMSDSGGSLTYNLGSGWFARIDNPRDGKKHIHVWNKTKKYAQNEDGSPHDQGNNSQGKLPNWLQKVLKEKIGWDYNGKRKEFYKKTTHETIYYMDYGSTIKSLVEYKFADGSIVERDKASSFNTINKMERIYFEGSNVKHGDMALISDSRFFFSPIFEGPIGVPEFFWTSVPIPVW